MKELLNLGRSQQIPQKLESKKSHRRKQQQYPRIFGRPQKVYTRREREKGAEASKTGMTENFPQINVRPKPHLQATPTTANTIDEKTKTQKNDAEAYHFPLPKIKDKAKILNKARGRKYRTRGGTKTKNYSPRLLRKHTSKKRVE